MRNRLVQENLADQFFSDSEDEYYLNRTQSTEGQAGPSSGDQQAQNAARRRRSAPKRRYNDMVSSGDDGEDYDDDVEFGRPTSESHKRAKRRQANRECARRIRQKKLEQLNSLTVVFEDLQRRNSQMLLDLGAITAQWHKISRENCEIQAQLTMAKAIREAERKCSGAVLEEFDQMVAKDGAQAHNNVDIQRRTEEMPVLLAV